MTYANHLSAKATPQTSPIPGLAQVPNKAGGFSFEVNDWTKLDRFLILGAEGGSYYASEKEMVLENASAIKRLLKGPDGIKVVERICEISNNGRAPKNDPAIFALAMCLKRGDLATRRLAAVSVPIVCRIGTHLFQFAANVDALGGWGRVTHRAFENWYKGQQTPQLAMNLAKYQSRGTWSHRDLLRKVKVKPTNDAMSAMFRWSVGKDTDLKTLPDMLYGFEMAKVATKPVEIVSLVQRYGLPRECIPTQFLTNTKVWAALLMAGTGMPLTAMIRNLGKMSQVGLLTPLSDASKFVVDRLADRMLLRKARIHPVQLLMANRIYAQGHGMKGSLTWEVDKNIVSGLEEAYYKSFEYIEPTDRNYLLALDVSGSMGSGEVAGTPMTPREASAAMAMVTLRTEPYCHTIGFTGVGGSIQDIRNRTHGFSYGGGMGNAVTELDLCASDSLTSATEKISNLPFGTTDCSLPMKYALERELPVDVFIVYTDNETYAGDIRPSQAIKEYRQKTGRDAKLVVVGMVANDVSIANPEDAGMLDVCGFDTSVPSIISGFVRGT